MKHKTYGMSIPFYGKPRTFKILSNRYKGVGRPKEDDYDYLTLVELQRRYEAEIAKRFDEVFK